MVLRYFLERLARMLGDGCGCSDSKRVLGLNLQVRRYQGGLARGFACGEGNRQVYVVLMRETACERLLKILDQLGVSPNLKLGLNL
jgi:hypothetical protein